MSEAPKRPSTPIEVLLAALASPDANYNPSYNTMRLDAAEALLKLDLELEQRADTIATVREIAYQGTSGWIHRVRAAKILLAEGAS